MDGLLHWYQSLDTPSNWASGLVWHLLWPGCTGVLFIPFVSWMQIYQPSGWSLSNYWICNGWIRSLLRSQPLSCSCRTDGLCPIIGPQQRPGPGQDGVGMYQKEGRSGKEKEGIPVQGAQLKSLLRELKSHMPHDVAKKKSLICFKLILTCLSFCGP